MATVWNLWQLYPWLVTGVFFHLLFLSSFKKASLNLLANKTSQILIVMNPTDNPPIRGWKWNFPALFNCDRPTVQTTTDDGQTGSLGSFTSNVTVLQSPQVFPVDSFRPWPTPPINTSHRIKTILYNNKLPHTKLGFCNYFRGTFFLETVACIGNVIEFTERMWEKRSVFGNDACLKKGITWKDCWNSSTVIGEVGSWQATPFWWANR